MTKQTRPTLVFVSWSSGKDSAWALHTLRQQPEPIITALNPTKVPADFAGRWFDADLLVGLVCNRTLCPQSR